MRILVTGAGGLLGGRLAALLAVSHPTTALVRRQAGPFGVPSVSADLIDPEAVGAALETSGAESVIHCAALADPEICERDPARARVENEEATRTLASACAARGARLIFISSDLVFGGETPFSTEVMPTAPLMEYGRSKLRAEAIALGVATDAVVLRTALICGRGHGPRLSASESIVERLRQGDSAPLFGDEWRTPIDPESVATAIDAVLRRPGVRGLFHLGGSTRLTRYELGERTASLMGLDRTLLFQAEQASHPGAPRPRDVSLSISHARDVLDWNPRPLELALREGRVGRSTAGDP